GQVERVRGAEGSQGHSAAVVDDSGTDGPLDFHHVLQTGFDVRHVSFLLPDGSTQHSSVRHPPAQPGKSPVWGAADTHTTAVLVRGRAETNVRRAVRTRCNTERSTVATRGTRSEERREGRE